MKRKIRFRGWDKVNLVMVPFTRDWICEEYSAISFSPPEDHEWSGIANLPGSYGHLADGESINTQYELMQYTGLKDKNGKEIYEGDVVEWKQAEGGILPANENTYTCQIKWIRNGWACEDIKPIKDDYHSCFTFSSSHMEIIGNIYENPELLKP